MAKKSVEIVRTKRRNLASQAAADARDLERLRAEIQEGIDSPDDLDFSFDKLRATLDAEDRKRKRP